MKLRVVLEPSEEGDFTALVPALPGCISEGDTREEALANIQRSHPAVSHHRLTPGQGLTHGEVGGVGVVLVPGGREPEVGLGLRPTLLAPVRCAVM